MEFNNLKVCELTKDETHQINGGGWIAYAAGWVCGQIDNLIEYHSSLPGADSFIKYL